MAVEIPCAEAVLAQLPTEVLQAIKGIVSTAKLGLEGLKIQYAAAKLNIDINLAPLTLKKAVLDKILTLAKNQIKIIPTELVAQCPQLGILNTTLSNALLSPIENIETIIFDIDRLSSVKADFNAKIDTIDSGIEFLDAVVESIDSILGG